MNVLSLFDGMSGTQLALKKLGIKVDKYYASEIDKYAIKVTQANFPDTIQVGDVTKLNVNSHIDLLVMGSPCQDLSFASRDKKGLEGERSGLFFEGLRLVKACLAINPNLKVLVENVRMTKANQDRMTKALSDVMGQVIEPVAINSNIFSAQNRYRLYWTNLNIPTLPSDKGIVMKDILETNVDSKYLAGENLLKNYVGGNQLNPNYKSQANTIHDHSKKGPTLCAGTHGYAIGYIANNYFKYGNMEKLFNIELKYSKDGLCHVGDADLKGQDSIKRIYHSSGKAPCLTTSQGGHREPKVYIENLQYRKLTPLECERLQTVPDNYTNHVSNTQRYKMLGNGFTIDTICHILSELK